MVLTGCSVVLMGMFCGSDGMFCGSAGLCLQVKLQRCLPFKHKVSEELKFTEVCCFFTLLLNTRSFSSCMKSAASVKLIIIIVFIISSSCLQSLDHFDTEQNLSSTFSSRRIQSGFMHIRDVTDIPESVNPSESMFLRRSVTWSDEQSC